MNIHRLEKYKMFESPVRQYRIWNVLLQIIVFNSLLDNLKNKVLVDYTLLIY